MKIKGQIIEVHVIRRNKGRLQFLLIKRAPEEIYPNLWQMVSGRIEKGEHAVHAAYRELLEETGLIPTKMWIVPQINSFYNPIDDEINVIPVFAALTEPELPVILSEEHTEFQWVSAQKAKKLLAWAGQRQVVDLITEYFSSSRQFLKFVELGAPNSSMSDPN